MACASCAVLAVRKCARLWKTRRIRATGYAAGRTAARVLERMCRGKAERTVAPQAYAPGTALAAAQKPTGLWKNTAHAKLMRARSRDSGRMAASAGFTAVVRTARMWYNRKRGAEPQAAATGGKAMANIVTGSRILLSVALLFAPACSAGFYALYLLCGLTDMVDGAIARRTNSASAFGARLDSAADCAFAAAALAKLMPVLELPGWLLSWTAAIAALKLLNVAVGFARRGRFMTEHTLLNKLTCLMLFALPMTLELVRPEYGAAVVCLSASIAALQEGWLIVMGRERA